MKRILPAIMILVACALTAAQVDLTGRVDEPLFASTETTASYTEFTFQLPECLVEDVEVDGVEYQLLTHKEAAVTIEEGLPELPFFATLVGVPDQGGVEVELVGAQYATIPNLNLYPSQGVHLEGETRGFVRDDAYYSGAKKRELSPVTISEPALLRGVRVVGVNVNPVSYDPVMGEATVMESATIRVRATREIGDNTPFRKMPRSRSFEKLYSGSILNWDSIRDESEPYQARSILVIHPGNSSLNDLVDQFVDWKRTKGFEIASVGTDVTGTSNSQIKNYIQNAYDTWENPPEYIVLIGDVGGAFPIATWFENYSSYNGEGDYPYTLLDGDDYLPDAFIGRISVEQTNHMMIFLSKMNLYEREVYTDDLGMYHRSVLVGETYQTGLSSIITNKYVKGQIQKADPLHTFTEIYHSDPNPNQVDAALNQGQLFFNYRGWIGMSGWDQSHVNGLDNVNKLVNATIITCSTGTFEYSSNTEALVRAGSPSEPTGGVSAIGMSTSGTHTQFNNILQGGIYHGIVDEGMRTMGEALVSGEVAMWVAYHECANNYMHEFIHWINQIGDPSMDIWVTEPQDMHAQYNSNVSVPWIDVSVTDAVGDPVEEAWVTARYGDDEIFVTGYTDASGQITLQFDSVLDNADVDLTVTKPNYKPELESFHMSGPQTLVFDGVTIDDDNNGESQGNDNEEVNPGEVIELIVGVRNTDSSPAQTGVAATIATGSPYITILDNEESFGDISGGSVGLCVEDFDIEISPDAPDRHEAMFVITIQGTSSTFVDRFWLTIHGCDLDITAYETDDNDNGVLDPGETAPLLLTVTNNGDTDLTNVYADLYSMNGLISELDTLAYFGDIYVGQTVTCSTDPFEVEALGDMVAGMVIDLQVTFFNDEGYEEVEILHMNVGEVTVNDAAGPDTYGYICYDSGDTGHSEAPTYDWIDISSIGTNTGMSDTGEEGDDIVWVDLPFTFRFYGEEYDGMTISSNGWVSFLETDQLTFRNWPVPGGLGPDAMIACFWDDLYTTNGGVYYYYDEDNHCFIVQWDCRNSVSSSSDEEFELILYDPIYQAAPTGDGVFKIQFNEFNNVDGTNSAGGAQGNYCTVGTESHTSVDGLQYTYDNNYIPGARTITDGSALFFTTTPIVYPDSWLSLGDIVVHDENGTGFIDAGETVNLGVWLENSGMTASQGAFATFTCYDSYATVHSDTSGYRFIDAGAKGVNRSYFVLEVSPDTPNGRELACNISITNADGAWNYPFFLTVHQPTLEIFSVMVNDLEGNNNGVMDPDESGKVIVNLRNTGLAPALNIQSTLSTEHEHVTIDNADASFGDLQPGEAVQRVFNVSVDASAEVPSSAWFELEIDATHIASQSFTFPMGIGEWGFSQDFETSNGGFSPYGTWQWGEPSIGAHSGTKVWATALTTNYGNYCDWFVGTGSFFIGDNTVLGFWHYYNTEEGHDGGNVKLSTNNGITWQIIEPVGGYPTTEIASNTGNHAIGGEPGFTGSSNGWEYVEFDLSAFANDDIKLRWHFGSDQGVVGWGWAFDDIVVSGGTERSGIVHGVVSFETANDSVEDIRVHANDFAVYPDDSGEFTLYTTAGIYDLTGSMRWYEPGVISELEVEQGVELFDQDLELVWLPEIDSLEYSLNNDTGLLTLNWSQPAQMVGSNSARRRETVANTRYDYAQTNIWMQQETGPATKVDSVVSAEMWQTEIDTEREYKFWVERQYDVGCSKPSNTVSINYVGVSGGDIPEFATTLRANYPNPFNPTTTIAFSMAQPGHAEVKVYNVRGQLVRTLANGHFEAGEHTLTWDGRDASRKPCSSGVYFYRLEAPGYTRTRKALMLK